MWSASLYLDRLVPDAIISSFGNRIRVDQFDSCANLTIFDLENNDWQELLQRLDAEGIRLRLESSVIEHNVVFDWNAPRNDWVAAILAPYGVARTENPPNDYEIQFRFPCQGIVREGRPLMLQVPPKGHLVAAGDHLVVSEALLQVLGCDPEILPAVYWRGQIQKGWRRFESYNRIRYLSELSYSSNRRSCAACGEWLVSTFGVWICESDERLTNQFARDVSGMSHHGRCHPLLISLDTALQVVSELGRDGYVLDPIYSRKCRVVDQLLGFRKKVGDFLGVPKD
ncbi:MAG: hypothetical protein KatS3mg105_2043 [Gemmatales bacterium]|nr:MAG: hypothetical protein KatS3mg105_2043 [Gemmatales bacterium]